MNSGRMERLDAAIVFIILFRLSASWNTSRRALGIAYTEELTHFKRHWLNLGQPWAFDRAVVTSCGGAGAANNKGWWKPSRMMDGVVTVGESLRATGSNVPAILVTFSSEPTAYEQCMQSKALTSARVMCFKLDDTVKRPNGYGYSKIAAIIAAPARIVLWIDADAYFVSNPDFLFAEASSGYPLFWPDFYGNFNPPPHLWLAVGQEKQREWMYRQGFDTGLLVIDKAASARQLHHLDTMSRPSATDYSKWAHYSMGDKDLWHLTWILDRAYFRLSSFAAIVAWRSVNSSNNFKLVVRHVMQFSLPDIGCLLSQAQAKCTHNGRVVVLHQNWHAIDPSSDETALFIVDGPRLGQVPWEPDISLGINLPHDPPSSWRISPAPRHILSILAAVRRRWFNFSEP